MRVQGNGFQDSFIFFTHKGDLTCGREINLSWCNVDTLRTVSLIDTDSVMVERIPPHESSVDVLMKIKNIFPPLRPTATNGPAKQYNAIIEFITKKRFGVQAGHFAKYSKLVMSNLLNITSLNHKGKSFLQLSKTQF